MWKLTNIFGGGIGVGKVLGGGDGGGGDNGPSVGQRPTRAQRVAVSPWHHPQFFTPKDLWRASGIYPEQFWELVNVARPATEGRNNSLLTPAGQVLLYRVR